MMPMGIRPAIWLSRSGQEEPEGARPLEERASTIRGEKVTLKDLEVSGVCSI
jgi:hypothetical protein